MLHDSHIFSGFSVNDLAPTKQFYQDVLGIEVEETPPPMTLLHLDGGRVLVYPKPNHEAATYTVLNFNVSDIAAVVIDLTAKGVTFEHYDSEWIKTDEHGIADQMGRKMAWFTDPAGNILSIIQEAPATA
ncbi:VOC family protein [Candidatus Saccharibacteria bacterium]|nr:VOC family protein [Candidatus Saccharibacteria bacterium]